MKCKNEESNVPNVRLLKDGRWTFKYRDKDKVQRMDYFGRGPEAKAEAEARALHFQADRRLGKKPEAKVYKVYFQELTQKYLDDKRNKVSEMYIYTLKRILNERGIGASLNKKPVNDLNYHDVTERIRSEFGSRSLSTQQRYLGYLHAIFSYGVRTKLTESNPLDAWAKVKEPERDVKLTVADVIKIVDAAPEHLRWAIICQWYCATRPGPSELFALTWDCFDLETDVATIKCTKNKETKFVPLRPEFKEMLKAMKAKAKSPYVITYKGQPVKSLRSSFKSACKKAGIPYKITMYDFRHLFTNTLRHKGSPDRPVADLAGHDETTMKKVYTHTVRAALEQAMAQLPSIIRKEIPTSVDEFPCLNLRDLVANLGSQIFLN